MNMSFLGQAPGYYSDPQKLLEYKAYLEGQIAKGAISVEQAQKFLASAGYNVNVPTEEQLAFTAPFPTAGPGGAAVAPGGTGINWLLIGGVVLTAVFLFK